MAEATENAAWRHLTPPNAPKVGGQGTKNLISFRFRLWHLAGELASAVGPARGKRILHVSDVHNGVAGLRLVNHLIPALLPAVVVNTGDLSGLGGWAESGLIRSFCRFDTPLVFARGNHDSGQIGRRLQSVGALCLDTPAPRVVEAGGIRFWGYADPNTTRLLGRTPYSAAKCSESMKRHWPPEGPGPLIAAVHNELMAAVPHAKIPLVLSGHFHSPRVHQKDETLFVRAGSTGGGGPFGGELQLAVIDVEPHTFVPAAVWLAEVTPRGVLIEQPLS